MNAQTSYLTALRCRECGRNYPAQAIYTCEYCFGPLDVVYDYDRLREEISTDTIASRPQNLWRYRELLPLEGEPTDGFNSGCTPLTRADNLARELGASELYLKDDSVNRPTLSYKDRVVPVALSRAKELGFDIVGCASTGNLANSVAAHAAVAGLRAVIFIPAGLEQGKVLGTLVYGPTLICVEGTYDEVNRLCTEITGKYRWGFVNVNLRPYYTEGAKTCAFEIAEQLGWRAPDHVVLPVAGGTLLPKVWKGFRELHDLGLIPDLPTKMHAAQPEGCSPVVNALKEGSELIRPVRKPETIALSLAIGNPADGYEVMKAVSASGGRGETATDDEIIEAIKLLARTEGIFTETAGGVTIAVLKKLIESGQLPRDEMIVACVTGNGLKTTEPVSGRLGEAITVGPSLRSFEERAASLLESTRPRARAAPAGAAGPPDVRAAGQRVPAAGVLVLSPEQVARIEQHARAAYPQECCGTLVGSRGDRTAVSSVHPAENQHKARARDRYQLDPKQILRLDHTAESEGREIVGFYHSHPDHPPLPSATDAEQAWPGYIYLIVGIGPGGQTEIKAWSYDETLRQFQDWPVVLDRDTTPAAGSGQPSAVSRR